MIETTIPEINVSELMKRVRDKVEQIRRKPVHPKLTPVADVQEIAKVIAPKPVGLKTEHLLQAIRTARDATSVSRWIPKPLRGLFRRQDKFDREILRAIEWLTNTNSQLVDRLRHLTACVEVQDQALQHLADLRRADGAWMKGAADIRESDIAWMDGLERLLRSIAESRGKLSATTTVLTRQVAALQQKNVALEQTAVASAEAVRAVRDDVDATGEHLRNLQAQADRINALATDLQRDQQTAVANAEAVRAVRGDVDAAGEHLRNLQAQADRINALATDLQRELASRADHHKQLAEQQSTEAAQRVATRRSLELIEQRQTSDSAFIKAELSRQSELVHKLIDGSDREPARSKPAAQAELNETATHHLDAFYFSFENRFRGSREEIKQRLQFYLPTVENCGAGKPGRPIADLGCGRGEWLELLGAHDLTAVGVDLNETMIDQCKQRALNVVQGDALEFLRSLPDDSQGAITAFHIIEHLPLEILVSIIAETFRALLPGGLAILESPNCKNLTVGASSFYIDPTHRNPVFPETAQFILESKGFERVTLEYLCPVDTTEISDIANQSAHLRELLYGPRDFGVIGYKPIGT